MSDYPFASDDNPSAPSDNPYQSPEAATKSSDVGGSDASMTRVADMLRQTKPWVRLISVLMLIGSAFMVFGGVAMMAMGAAGMPGMPGAILGLVYIVMAILYVVPAVYLWRYAGRIGSFLQQESIGSLASALEAQKSFWKFVGIVALIVLCIYAFIIVFAAIAGIASSM